MTQRESKLSRDIMNALRREGAFAFKVWGSEHMMSGLPDIIGCYQGFFFGFETKNPESRNNTSTRQRYVMELIATSGGLATVVCTPSEAVQLLQRFAALRSAETIK